MKLFEPIAGLSVEFSTVEDGNMSFVWGSEADVIKNRQLFLDKIGVKAENSTIINLEHGIKIYKIESPKANLFDKAKQEALTGDGLITDRPSTVLMLVVADCIPAALYDSEGHKLCILHAGRKGVEQNILAEAVKMMSPKDIGNLILMAGPAIGVGSYVFDTKEGVDIEFWKDDFSRRSDGKYHMDIKNKFKSQAIELGLAEDKVHISNIDTFEDKNYFSHRRSMATGEREGRFAIVAEFYR